MDEERAKEFLKNNFYFDIHGHAENLLPRIYKIIKLGKVPRDVKLKSIANIGINGFVVCAIGDPNSFKLFKVDPFESVKKQLNQIKNAIKKARGIIARTIHDFERAKREKRSVFVIGIEGGDFIQNDITRLDYVFKEGVRLLLPVHFSKNSLGSIMLGFGNRIIPEEEHTGLTELGKEVIKRAEKLGIIIDLSHADIETLTQVVEITSNPLICSHTGPRELQDYHRYIPDEIIKEIAKTGGLVGMWPFFDGKWGIPSIEIFIEYAKHLKKIAGAAHLAIGTDINAVPGNMEGYRNLYDAHRIIIALSEANFTEDEIKGVIGLNFLNIFDRVTSNKRG